MEDFARKLRDKWIRHDYYQAMRGVARGQRGGIVGGIAVEVAVDRA